MVQTLLAQFTYVAILGLLVGAGVGVPFPEDVTLLTTGYLAREGVVKFVPALLVGYVGVLIGDFLIYRLGRRLGPGVMRHRWLARVFTEKRLAWFERHFAKRGMLTVVIGRHTAGLRAPTFAMAGAMGVPVWRFLLADALSAMVTVPVVTYLGYFFAEHLERVKGQLHRVELIGLLALVAGGLVYGVWSWRRRLRLERAAQHPEIHVPPRPPDVPADAARPTGSP